jgi:hypothetical protein
MKGRLGGYVGGTIGCLGWMIGFTVVCLASDNMEVWSRFAFTGFIVSLAMAGILILTLELALRTFGRGGMFQLTLWGELTFFMGVLALLLNHWVAPILESSPRMMEALNRLGGYHRTSDLLPTALLAASAVLMAVVVVRLLKTGGRSREE